MRRPVSRLLARVRGPKLKEAFTRFAGDAIDSFPVAALFMTLGFMAKKSSGYPIGGSSAFARAIEGKYLSLGGKIRYGTKVDGIVVEGGKAVGLRGAWGEERGDYIVSAADGFDSVNRLLGGRYPHPQLEASFDGKGDFRRYPSLIYIGLGLGRDFKDTPHMQSFTLDEPLALEGGVLKIKRLNLRLFTFDPTMAPEGKTSATAMIETSNDAYWTELRGRDRAACEAEKAQTARKVIAALDGFVPGLGNFYMIGQWTSPGGGLPPCGIGGRGLAKKLCRLEGRSFKAD